MRPRLRPCPLDRGLPPVPFLLLLLLLLGAMIVPMARAHRVTSVSLISHLDTQARTYVLDAAMEVVPSEDPSVNDQISPEDAAREFAGYLVVMFDEAEQQPEMEITLEETSDEETPPELRRRQVLTKLSGAIPEGAKEFLLYLDPRCPMAVVMVVIKDQQPSRRMQVILSGEYSRPVSVAPVEEGDPFEKGTAAEPVQVPPDDAPSGESPRPGAFATGWRAFFLESALPPLLVLATLLLTLGRTSVVWQIGILLAGQGIVVCLAAWSLLPKTEAAPVLAGLVAILTLESLFHRHLRWWRFPVLAAAGVSLGCLLAAGPAFRSFLASGAPGTGEVMQLLLGAESALLLVALVAAAILLPLSRHGWYRKVVVVPLAVLVSGFALFAAVERFL